MNMSDGVSLTTPSPHASANVTGASETTPLAFLTQKITIMEAVPAAPTAASALDAAVIAVVIAVMVLTFVVLALLLYRYQCHNKGAYRTTGELAPGEDPDEGDAVQDTGAKKEYFI